MKIPKSILLLFLSFSLAFSSQIDRALSQTAEKLTGAYRHGKEINFRKRIAVSELENKSDILIRKKIGEALSGMLMTEFTRSTVFEVVERKSLDRLLREHELILSGAVDDSRAAEAGKLLAADVLLLGDVSEMGDDIQVNLRLIDVESGEVFAESFSLKKSELLPAARDVNMAFVQKRGVGISINFLSSVMSGEYATLSPAMPEDMTGINTPMGISIKYRAARFLMFEVGLDMFFAQIYHNPNLPYDPSVISFHTNTGSAPFTIFCDGANFPLNVYFVFNLTRRFNLFLGSGFELAIVKINGTFISDGIGGGMGFGINEIGPEADAFFPRGNVMAGFEVFFTPRAAYSFKFGYSFGTGVVDLAPQLHLQPILPAKLEESLSGFTLKHSMSLYF